MIQLDGLNSGCIEWNSILSSCTLRELGVTPRVVRRQNGAVDQRTSRHPGYAISLSKRWLVEKPFDLFQPSGPLKKVKLRGLAKVD